MFLARILPDAPSRGSNTFELGTVVAKIVLFIWFWLGEHPDFSLLRAHTRFPFQLGAVASGLLNPPPHLVSLPLRRK